VASRKQTPVIRVVQQLEQDWRCHVVGKVADDANRRRFVAQELGEIHVEEIGLHHANVGKESGKRRGEVAVDFDRDDIPRARGQRHRERPTAGTDFEEGLAGLRIERCISFATQADSRKCWPNRLRGR
jgi:hypothetical protein